MTARVLYVAGRSYDITGEGYGPAGEVRFVGKKAEAQHIAPLRELATVLLGCNHSSLIEKDGTWKMIGDPTEGALPTAGTKTGYNRQSLEQEFLKQRGVWTIS
jgi:Ca2+-transporting ATPase